MSAMIDKWHDRYHRNEPDMECIHCQEAAMEAETAWMAEMMFDPDVDPIDRLEDLFAD